MWGDSCWMSLQLLQRQVYSVARLCPDRSFWSGRCVINIVWLGLDILYKVNSNSNNFQFSEFPSASTRVRHTGAEAAAHPLEFEVASSRTSQFAIYRNILLAPSLHCDLPYTVFDTGTMGRIKGAVNRWLIPWFVISFSVAQVLVGLRKQFINIFIFPTFACADGFNKNNYMGNKIQGIDGGCGLSSISPEHSWVGLPFCMLYTSSHDRAFQIVVISIRYNCWATDVLKLFYNEFFRIVPSSVIEVIIEEPSCIFGGESVQVFKYYN